MDFDEFPIHILEQVFLDLPDKDLGRWTRDANKRFAKLALTMLATKYKNKMAQTTDYFMAVKSNGNLLLYNYPKHMQKPPVRKYKSVFTAENSIFLTEDNEIFIKGRRNIDGEMNVPPLGPVKTVSYSGDHVLALEETGQVKGWGNNYGDVITIPDFLKTKKVIDIITKSYYSMALLDNSHLVGWGKRYRDPPEYIQGKIKQVDGDFDFYLALLHNGTLVLWDYDPRFKHLYIPDNIQGKVILINQVTNQGYSVLLDDGTLYIKTKEIYKKDSDIPPEYQGKFVGHIWNSFKHYGLLYTGEVVSWPKKSPKINLFT